jgi:heptosyltransferase-2
MSAGVSLSPDLQRLLIVCPSWVGDTVMATPVFRAVSAAYPDARIIALMRPGLDHMLAGVPWIHDRITVDLAGLRGPGRAARSIRRHDPQAALLLPNSFCSALAVRLAGVPKRLGYDRDGRGLLLTDRVPAPKSALPIPMLDYFGRLAAIALGVPSIDLRPELVVGAVEEEAADRLLEGVAGGFVLLNPGANRAAKRWPTERFARAGDALAERYGLAIVVTGSPAEATLARSIAEHAENPVVDLVERGVDLGSLRAVIARAKLVITNDTGPRHIAAALGTPTVSLFGPTDHRWTTLDVAHERCLLAEPFLPETLVAERHARLCSIDRIELDDMIAAAEALLDAGHNPTAMCRES